MPCEAQAPMGAEAAERHAEPVRTPRAQGSLGDLMGASPFGDRRPQVSAVLAGVGRP
jgi:hypothetical protein